MGAGIKLKGLYMELPACGHTYGISAINDPSIYDALNTTASNQLTDKWFRQSDSMCSTGDKHYLLFEFLGQSLTENQALKQCEEIAAIIGCELNIL